MKNIKLLIFILVCLISSFLFANKVEAYFKDSEIITNNFTIKNNYLITFKYSYIDENDIKHELQGNNVVIYHLGDLININDLIDSNIDYSTVNIYIDNIIYSGNTLNVQDDNTIEIVYTLNRYIITYNLAGGEENTNPTSYTEKTGNITLNYPSKATYDFIGWTWLGQDEPVLDVSFTGTDKENKEFTAHYERQKTTYHVIHKQMNLDGSTYTTKEDEEIIETMEAEVTPAVKNYQGFTSPTPQTVTVAIDGSTVVTYLYERNQYQLTIINDQYVTTETPSGLYYYESVISMDADEYINGIIPFTKWNTGTTSTHLEFSILEDTEIIPHYGNSYTIYLDANGGTVDPLTLEKYINEPLGTLPTPVYDTCDITGSMANTSSTCEITRNFEGWFLDQNLENPVPDNYAVTNNDTFYAKWNTTYYQYTEEETIYFDGVDDYLDLGINFYSEENIDKDFTISFDLLEVSPDNAIGGTQNGMEQPTILNVKDETYVNNWPGFVVRLNTGSAANVYIKSKWNGRDGGNAQFNRNELPVHLEFTRVNGVVSVTYTNVNGTVTTKQLYNQNSAPLTRYSPLNVVFGATQGQNGEYKRFFKGAIANINVEMNE